MSSRFGDQIFRADSARASVMDWTSVGPRPKICVAGGPNLSQPTRRSPQSSHIVQAGLSM